MAPRSHFFVAVAVLCWLACMARARTVVVGDIHGDYDSAMLALRMSDLVDPDGNWVGGNDTLVQMGDLIDRGPDDLKVIDLMRNITKGAEAAGGKVVVLLGNHELMNIYGEFHYVHPDSMTESGGAAARKDLFGPHSDVGAFIRSLPVIYMEHGTVFVHAGLLPEFAKYGVVGLNQMAQSALHEKDGNKDKVFSVHGPVWTRMLIKRAQHNDCGQLKESLAALNAKRMVVGHTPQRAGHLETYCDDALIAVDVGLSRWMYSNMATLELTVEGGDDDVVMREITLPPPKTDGAADGTADNQDTVGATGSDAAAAATLDDALNQDPYVLQEMLDTIREAQQDEAEGKKLGEL